MIPKLLVTSLVACKDMRARAPVAHALKDLVRECAPGRILRPGVAGVALPALVLCACAWGLSAVQLWAGRKAR